MQCYVVGQPHSASYNVLLWVHIVQCYVVGQLHSISYNVLLWVDDYFISMINIYNMNSSLVHLPFWYLLNISVYSVFLVAIVKFQLMLQGMKLTLVIVCSYITSSIWIVVHYFNYVPIRNFKKNKKSCISGS